MIALTDSQPDALGPDLGALLARVLPRLAELEAPALEAAGLSMWEYAILTELATGQAISQRQLSQRVRRDPTRLGRHLDDLEERGLVERVLGDDKRQRTVRLTRRGQRSFQQAKQQIQLIEDALLTGPFTPSQAKNLRSMLEQLAVACSASPPGTTTATQPDQ